MVGTLEPRARVEASLREMVHWRQAQRQRQLSRSACTNSSKKQGRSDLGRGAWRPKDVDILGAISRSEQVCERLEKPRRRSWRPRRHLSADGARASNRDAGVRSDWRDPQRCVRWLQRRILAGSNQRREGEGVDNGRRRFPAWTDDPFEEDG